MLWSICWETGSDHKSVDCTAIVSKVFLVLCKSLGADTEIAIAPRGAVMMITSTATVNNWKYNQHLQHTTVYLHYCVITAT